MNGRERFEAMNKVIDFAKANGFPGAENLFWPESDSENGYTELSEALCDAEYGEEESFSIGITLSKKIKAKKTIDMNTECDDYIIID